MPIGDEDFIREVLGRIGDKWSLLVITNLARGPLRYTDLQRAITGISQRMLTLTLSQLHRDGLLTRTSHPEVPPRVEYALSPLGTSLLEIVRSLVTWAITHHDEIRTHRETTDTATPTKNMTTQQTARNHKEMAPQAENAIRT